MLNSKRVSKANDNFEVENIINILKNGQETDAPLGVMAVGRMLVIYNGVNPLRRFKCSNSIEASKTADRIQAAYDQGYFKNQIALQG